MGLGRKLETYGGPFISGVLTVGTLYFHPSFYGSMKAISNLPTITTCMFGFLLTLFGIIIQGNGAMIKKMKSTNVVFDRYISFTKRVIWISLFLSVFAFAVGSINLSWWNIIFEELPTIRIIIEGVILLILLFFSFWLILDLIYFIHLFFLLIRTEK